MRTPALDHELRGELDLAAALREASRSVPGPDPAASARMRASLMEAIGGHPEGTDAPERERPTSTRVLDTAVGSPRRSARPDDSPRRSARPDDSPRRSARPGSHHSRDDTRPADGRPERGRRRRSRSRTGRILNNVLTGTCVVMLLGALTVVMSRGALPDDTLYGVKRASESVEMGLTSGQEAKGRKHLEFAAVRLDEISGLVDRGSVTAAGPGPVASAVDPRSAALIGDNLREFDDEVRAGSRMMLQLSGRPSGPDASEVDQWARTQSDRLSSLSPSFSSEDQVAAESSQALLTQVSSRAVALDERSSCPEVSTGTDDLGPLPSGAECDTLATPTERPAPPSDTSTTTSTTAPSREPSTTTDAPTTTTSPEPGSSTTSSTEPGSTTPEQTESTTPPPVQVPMPVPLLPPVDVPPLIPGLPGLSLG